MTYGEAIRSILTGSSAVTDLCGTRIYSAQLPIDASMPAVTYRFTGGAGEAFVSDGQTEGIDRQRMEISSWASRPTAARALAAAVRSALHGWRGWQGTTEIQLVSCEAIYDIPEPETDTFRAAFFADVTFSTR